MIWINRVGWFTHSAEYHPKKPQPLNLTIYESFYVSNIIVVAMVIAIRWARLIT